MPLSNEFNNRINDHDDSSNEENIISHLQTRNATSSCLLGTGRNNVTRHSEIEKGVTRKNIVAGHSKKRKVMKGVNRNFFEVSFFNQRITKCN